MPKLGNVAVCLALVLAGCSTSSNRERATDWTAPSANQSFPESYQHSSRALIRRSPAGTSKLAETWIPLARWSATRGFGPVRHISDNPRPTFAVLTTNGLLEVLTDSRLAYWNKLEIRLGFAPQLVAGQPYIEALDLAKNIDPLLSKPAFLSKSNVVIVIDPGHGGSNRGAHSVNNDGWEKQFTLDWALRLAPLLRTNGWQVFLTRTNDVDMSLPERVTFATKHDADLFISLHFNSAAPNESQKGLEAYCLTPAGLPSNLTRGYADDRSLVFPNNKFDAENWRLAFRLQSVLLRITGDEDRGLRHARFMGVLRGQKCPAVLIEGGYLSNPGQARSIANPNYREMLAEAMAEALTGKPIPGSPLSATTESGSHLVSDSSAKVSEADSTAAKVTHDN